ncbi:MAG: hypothetical protein MJ121_06740 [Clostridia bacterium]|nr:hypothetical protein [Clostridia bacterium]
MKSKTKKIIIIAVCIVLAALIGCGAFLGVKEYRRLVTPVNLYQTDIESADFEKPLYLIAHRGEHTQCPENSIPAFKSAIEKGYYAVECDIIRTSDGKWVIAHDNNLFPHFKASGLIEEKTFDEVRSYKYYLDRNAKDYQDEKIPTLEEYLDLFVGTDVRPQIEIKSNTTENIADVLKAIDERGLTEQVIIISFFYDSLKEVKKLNPEIEMWYLSGEMTDEAIANAKELGCPKISVNHSEISYNDIERAKKAGLETAIWTVDSPDSVRIFYNLGVNCITSNIICY